VFLPEIEKLDSVFLGPEYFPKNLFLSGPCSVSLSLSPRELIVLKGAVTNVLFILLLTILNILGIYKTCGCKAL